jgi:hypothetical protein
VQFFVFALASRLMLNFLSLLLEGFSLKVAVVLFAVSICEFHAICKELKSFSQELSTTGLMHPSLCVGFCERRHQERMIGDKCWFYVKCFSVSVGIK